MKTKLMISWITVSLFMGMNGIHGQPEAGQLDQAALMQQFVGTWQNEYKPDTFILWKIQPYGKGWKASYEIATTGKVLREAKKLIGIDPDSGIITNFTLIEDNGKMVVFLGKFVSGSKMYMEVRDKANPEKVIARKYYSFPVPDKMVVTKEFGPYGARPGIYKRIKDSS